MRLRMATLRTLGGHVLAGGMLVLVGVSAGIPAQLCAAEEDVELLVQRMEPLWDGRDKPGALHDLISLGRVALAIDADNYDVLWRTARAQFWVAHTQGDRFIKKAMAAQAMATAERAIAARPGRVEGHYLYAVAVGEYATTIGIVRAFREGIAGKIEDAGQRAYEIDRNFDSGAPMAVLGRYYFSVPWPKRDLARSRRYLEELRVRHPGALTGRLYLAETYRDLGDEARSRAELRYVLRTAAPADEAGPRARDALQSWFPE